MKKTPCETLVWDLLPCIRRQLAEKLKEKGLSQRDIALKVGVSEAAVSQYFSNKRGKNSSFDDEINQKVAEAAEAILRGANPIEQICLICSSVKDKVAADTICSIC